MEYCRGSHTHIVVRVPHTTHLIQGEDVCNFKIFKPELASQRPEEPPDWREYQQEHLSSPEQRLHSRRAASLEEGLQHGEQLEWMEGDRHQPLLHHVMCIMHDLKAEEELRPRLSESANLINCYERLSLTEQGRTHERTEEEQDAELLHGRISSADKYVVGVSVRHTLHHESQSWMRCGCRSATGRPRHTSGHPARRQSRRGDLSSLKTSTT